MSEPIQSDAGLPDSRLYTFIDEPREFALYFLEGQRLIHDMALRHTLDGPGFAFFRDALLSVQPMIALIKGGEQLGVYLDSDEPFFKLKIEAAHHGATRCALVPDDFREFPEAMHGRVRVLKLFPRNRPPYESILEVPGLGLRDVVNLVLRESYQVHSAVLVSQQSDQSAMLHQLPPLKDEYEYSLDVLRRRRDGVAARLEEVFARGLHDDAAIRAAFAALDFRLLASRPITFQCSCSRQRVIRGIRLAIGEDVEQLFEPSAEHVEIVCEYCKAVYHLTRDDLRGPLPGTN